jgi:hypothetical protein
MSDLIAELRAERERAQKLEWELAKMRARTESSPLDEGARERVANLERGLASAVIGSLISATVSAVVVALSVCSMRLTVCGRSPAIRVTGRKAWCCV